MPVDEAFFSRVSHDLRGELATMVAGIHYLLRYERGLSATGRQMGERVNGAGQRLGRLIDELELAAFIDGAPAGVTLATERCAAATLVRDAVTRLSRAVTERRATVDVEEEGGGEIEVDAELYGAALEHVIDLAVARSPGGAVRVTVRADGAVRVCDAGGAIAPEVMARLFDPFVERDLLPRPEPGARRRERLGLGLAIARGLAIAHGGSAAAEQIEGGLAVTITPPCAAPRAV